VLYEIEATIVRTALVEADNDKDALQLAIADLRETMWETEIYTEDLKIVSRSEAAPTA
jgi:hypothetical protein